jgi:hypothetical protein
VVRAGNLPPEDLSIQRPAMLLIYRQVREAVRSVMARAFSAASFNQVSRNNVLTSLAPLSFNVARESAPQNPPLP